MSATKRSRLNLEGSAKVTAATAKGSVTSNTAISPASAANLSAGGWALKPSKKAQRTKNPIRRIVDKIQAVKPKCDKELIPLSLGDPTVYGNLLAPGKLTEAVVKQVRGMKANGYAHSAGTPQARVAVARFMSYPGAELTAEDIIMASGGSGALEMAITALVDEGDNLLVPQPGFPLYQVIAESNGSHVKEYPLLPERDWEVDVAALEALVDDRTRAIVVNNPSNPCGSLFSDANLRGILAVAERKQLPIIADEIYGFMVFGGAKFSPIASLTTTVPVLSVSGMAKMFLVPGWRVGWIQVHDRHNILADSGVRQGLINLSQLILGSNTIAQVSKRITRLRHHKILSASRSDAVIHDPCASFFFFFHSNINVHD